ncbi:glycine receptor subunit alpha-2-like [Saccoglossus kowalevskii]
MLENLKTNYSKEIRPYEGEKTLEVKCALSISTFSTVDASSMDYAVTFYLRQVWRDPRLQSNAEGALIFQSEAVEQIWTPLIIFPGEKDGKLHDLADENQYLQIWPNGTVVLTMRLTLTLICHMKTDNFPMDKQECPLSLQSLSYPATELELIWDRVIMRKDIHVPSFTLGVPVTESCESEEFNLVEMSCLNVVFPLKRYITQFLLQIYLTSTLVVFLSWISFWINSRSEPARITLGMTSVLTLSTEITGVQAAMAVSSNASAIDVWLAMCLIFVFAVLIEFAVLNHGNTKLARMSRVNCPQQPKENNKPVSGVVVEMEIEESQEKDKQQTYVGYRAGRTQRFKRFFRVEEPDDLDRISRVMFPTLFVIFTAIYWASYLMES